LDRIPAPATTRVWQVVQLLANLLVIVPFPSPLWPSPVHTITIATWL